MVMGVKPPVFAEASHAELTPIDHLLRSAVVHGGRLAIVDGDIRLTYAKLLEECTRQAGLLAELGVIPGDRVAVLAPNTSILLQAHFSIPMAGAVLVALNTRLKAAEIAAIVEHCGARLAIVDEDFLDRAGEITVPVIAAEDFRTRAQSATPL